MSEDGRCDGCEFVEQLRRDLETKHGQNRKDIHGLRNEAQKLVLEIVDLRGKILPIIGNGQPGLLAKISDQIVDLTKQVTDVRIAQGMDSGRRGENEWLRSVVTSAVVGGLLILAQHFWK